MIKSILITDPTPAFFSEELKKRGFAVNIREELKQDELGTAMQEHTHLLIRGRLRVGKKEFKLSNKLKAILRPGSGIEQIDLAEAVQMNVRIITSPEGNSGSVGDHTVGMLLALLRNIRASATHVREYGWNRKHFTGDEMAGQTIGIIGYGHTGSAFAQRLSGFPCKVLAYDKYKSGYGNEFAHETSLSDLQKHASVISFHVPFNTETRDYLGETFINNLTHPVYILNTSRGDIANIPALLLGMDRGKVKGAGLDVLPGETSIQSRKQVINSLAHAIDAGKVIVTPHIAGLSHDSEIRIFKILLDKLKAYERD